MRAAFSRSVFAGAALVALTLSATAMAQRLPTNLAPGDDPGVFVPYDPGNEPGLIPPDTSHPDLGLVKTSCCIPRSFGDKCVEGYVGVDGGLDGPIDGAPADENECNFNEHNPDVNGSAETHDGPGIWPDPRDGLFYPGTVSETSKPQCDVTCGAELEFYYCMNRDDRAEGEQAQCASTYQLGLNNERLITDAVKERERGYLSRPLPNGGGDPGYDTCIEACAPDTCESCDRLTEVMNEILPDSASESRTQFCNQAHNSCTTGTDTQGRTICVQKPKCTMEYLGICDLQEFDYVVTNTDSNEEGDPPELNRFRQESGNDGTPNPDYVSNLRWLPPARGGLEKVDELLDSRGLSRSDAIIDLEDMSYRKDPITDEMTDDLEYTVVNEGEMCKPRYHTCCDTVGGEYEIPNADPQYDSEGNLLSPETIPTGPWFFIAEEHNAPVTRELQQIVDSHDNVTYVNFDDIDPEDEDYFNDIQGCINWDGQITSSRRFPWGELSAEQLTRINETAAACTGTYRGRSSSEHTEAEGCYACYFKPTQALCTPKPPVLQPGDPPYIPFCRWSRVRSPDGTSREYCLPNDLPVNEGGNSACPAIDQVCRTCHLANDETSCRRSAQCQWTGFLGHSTEVDGICAPSRTWVGPNGERCIPEPPDTPKNLACTRTIGRLMARDPDYMAEKCFAYSRGLAAVTIPFNTDPDPVDKADLLKTHFIMFDTSDEGKALCDSNCEKIALYGYFCDKEVTGEVHFGPVSTARQHRSVTWDSNDDGTVDEAYPGDAAIVCGQLHENFLALPPEARNVRL